MHTWSCSPFAPEAMLQVSPDGHVAVLVQVGEQ
jgi:hypothetical protein